MNSFLEDRERRAPSETEVHNSSPQFQHVDPYPESLEDREAEGIGRYPVVLVVEEREQAMEYSSLAMVLAYVIAERVMGVVSPRNRSTKGEPEERVVQRVDLSGREVTDEQVGFRMTVTAATVFDTTKVWIVLVSSEVFGQVQVADSFLNHWV